MATGSSAAGPAVPRGERRDGSVTHGRHTRMETSPLSDIYYGHANDREGIVDVRCGDCIRDRCTHSSGQRAPACDVSRMLLCRFCACTRGPRHVWHCANGVGRQAPRRGRAEDGARGATLLRVGACGAGHPPAHSRGGPRSQIVRPSRAALVCGRSFTVCSCQPLLFVWWCHSAYHRGCVRLYGSFSVKWRDQRHECIVFEKLGCSLYSEFAHLNA